MKDLVTILVSTSPVPSHPDTALLDETIARLRAYPELADCPLILMADGVRPEQQQRQPAYDQFKARIAQRIASGQLPHFTLLEAAEHQHQANMTMQALEQVRTPFIFFCEHDTYPVGDVPMAGIVEAMRAYPEQLKHVRLHIFERMIAEHDYLMFDKQPIRIGGLPLVRTKQWSQRPHFAGADYYRSFLSQYFQKHPKTFIEDPLYGIILEDYEKGAPVEKWGMAIYAPEGDTRRSGHTCGRTLGANRPDPKFSIEAVR